MSIFVIPNIFTGNVLVDLDGFIENFELVETEFIDGVSNLAKNSVTTLDIEDDAVTGDKIYIDTVTDDTHIVSVEHLNDRYISRDTNAAYIYDVYYILGERPGEDDLYWDESAWADNEASAATWADAPVFDMTKIEADASNPDRWRSAVWKIEKPCYMSIRVKQQSLDALVALFVGYKTSLAAFQANMDDNKLFYDNSGSFDEYKEPFMSEFGSAYSATAEYVSGNFQGTLNAAYSGVLTSIEVTGVRTDTELSASGTIRLINSSSEYDDISYSSYSVANNVYTFVTTDTLTYSYAEDDVIAVLSDVIDDRCFVAITDVKSYKPYFDTVGHSPSGSTSDNAYWEYIATSTDLDIDTWQDLKIGESFIEFMPLMIQYLTDATYQEEISQLIMIPASEETPAYVQLIAYKVAFGASATTAQAIGTDTFYVEQATFMALGEPGSGETLISKEADS